MFAGHQIGARDRSVRRQFVRTQFSTYLPAFFVAGGLLHHRGAGGDFGAQVIRRAYCGGGAGAPEAGSGKTTPLRLDFVPDRVGDAGAAEILIERMPVGDVTLISVK